MSTPVMPPLVLERRGATTSSNNNKEEESMNSGCGSLVNKINDEEQEESVCFSDADDDGSCCSQFYSIADGYDDCEISEEEVGSRRASSVALSVEMDNADREVKLFMEGVERDCRICHMGLETQCAENGVAIELGCSCKHDLATAHKYCAETWFKIKGNNTCEICNSIASNVVGPNNQEIMHQTIEIHSVSSSYVTGVTGQVTSASETRRCLNGHRFVNFLLACMVFAFVISWLFHFNIPA